MTVSILVGDCLESVRDLPDQSVNCCVTSPPYFGLRDYGHAGQIGLESTPDEFIAKLVAVFHEVKRVLRDDGTLWVNIGDSYAGGGGGNYNTTGKTRANGCQVTNVRNRSDWLTNADLKAKDLIGIPWMLAFALRQPYYDWQIKTEAMRAWVAGIVDGEGCITIMETKSSHSESLSYPPIVQVRMCDLEPMDRLVQAVGSSYGKPQHPPSHLAANQRPSYQWKVVSAQAANVIAEIYPFLTCKRKQAIVAWNHQAFRSARGNGPRMRGDIEKEQFCKALINSLNQREPVDIPSWMKEPTIAYEPGWYLRQDLIWSKPNPMPESVTDRCTKAHEYIFMLSKSARYYFDSVAIAEDSIHAGAVVKNDNGKNSEMGEYGATRTGFLGEVIVKDTRNKRSVWTVTTKPFSEAHFATFPPDLIEPAILAGCPVGGTVLDPFGGAGTTGLVCDRLQRNAILCELNPTYAEMARKRIFSDSPLFAEVA